VRSPPLRALALAVLIGPLSSVTPAADAVKPAPLSHTVISAATMDAPQSRICVMTRTSAVKPRSVRCRWVISLSRNLPPTSPSWIIGLFDYVGQFGGLLLWVVVPEPPAVAAVWILPAAQIGRTARRPAIPTWPIANCSISISAPTPCPTTSVLQRSSCLRAGVCATPCRSCTGRRFPRRCTTSA